MNIERSIDTPISEITLRRYEKPIALNERELLKRVCLSIGILQPGDSRDVIIDIFDILIKASKEKVFLSSDEVRERIIMNRTEKSVDMNGLAPSNIRRQLKRLRDIQLCEKIKNKYRITEFLSLIEIFDERIKKLMLTSITERVREYIDLYEKR